MKLQDSEPMQPAPADTWTIRVVAEADLDELLPLMRGYCDFYEVTPSDASLMALSRALSADPLHEGVQLIARGSDGQAVGFATVYWSWSTAQAARIGVLNDLFVAPNVRGRGAAEALIAAGLEQCRQRGAVQLSWQTAPDNHRAQRVYDRIGATREQWLDYFLPVSPADGEAPSPRVANYRCEPADGCRTSGYTTVTACEMGD